VCGRYTLRATPAEIAEVFSTLRDVPGLPPRYNIGPGQKCLVLRTGEGGPEPAEAKWGFQAPHVVDARKKAKPINASAETVSSNRPCRRSRRPPRPGTRT
jgi:putative SOS response-associated peptidase YedK